LNNDAAYKEGWEMIAVSERNDGDDYLKIKKIEKIKEELLDETFKKAEKRKKSKNFLLKEKKELKKCFPIFGVIFIFISIMSIFIINYLPWMYIKYNNSELNEIESFFYKDFKTKFENDEILMLMGQKCNNCYYDSKNYIGLSKEDFIFIPRYLTYVFIALLLFGLFYSIFSIIDRFCNFSVKSVTLFCSIFAIAEIIIGVIILSFCVRFLGANFLINFNKTLIENIGLYNVKLIILAPILLMVFAFVIIKGALTSVNLNFKELKKRSDADNSSRLFTTPTVRGSVK